MRRGTWGAGRVTDVDVRGRRRIGFRLIDVLGGRRKRLKLERKLFDGIHHVGCKGEEDGGVKGKMKGDDESMGREWGRGRERSTGSERGKEEREIEIVILIVHYGR